MVGVKVRDLLRIWRVLTGGGRASIVWPRGILDEDRARVTSSSNHPENNCQTNGSYVEHTPRHEIPHPRTHSLHPDPEASEGVRVIEAEQPLLDEVIIAANQQKGLTRDEGDVTEKVK